MKMPAGLIFDDSRHYVDHLAPFCALQGWPLIVCESDAADLARRYYPDLEVIEKNRWDLRLPSQIVSCSPRELVAAAFPLQPTPRLYWLPHGNSDKGWKAPFFEPLHGELALVYGQRMIDFMKEKNVVPQAIRLGNFRLHYWQKHRPFYDAIVQRELPIRKGRKTYLYAPTWDDAEGNGSFWQSIPILAERLPEDADLIVKVHPNLQHKYAAELERLIGRYGRIHFLFEFPLIYPLLDLCDAYIGDMSSIGYDFLHWKRPMFFFENTGRSQFLYRCGKTIRTDQIETIFTDPPADYTRIQEEVYRYTFDPYVTLRLEEAGQRPF